MPTCPRCQMPVAHSGALCASCGSAARGPLAGPPDLELGPPVARPPAPATLRSVGAALPVAEEDDEHPSLDVEIGVPTKILPGGVPLAPALRPLPSSAPEGTALALLPEAAPAIDVELIARLGGYGPTPEGWAGAPAYAIRVQLRRRELRAQRRVAQGKLHDARSAELASLSRFTEEIAPRIPTDHPAKNLLASLLRFDHAAATHGAMFDATSREAALRVATVDQKIASKEAEKQTIARELAEAERELTEQSARRDRAEAKVKRVQIELRAAHDAARLAAGPEGKFAPPEHARRIHALEEEQAQRESEMTPVVRAQENATSLVTAHKAAIRAADRDLRALLDERRLTERSSARRVRAESAGAADTARARLEAYAEVGRTILRTYPDLTSASERAESDALAELTRRAIGDVDLLEHALTAANGEAERRGLVVLGGAVAALVLVLILVVR